MGELGKKPRIAALVSTKGGVGKSSCTILIANYLRALGNSVLVVDGDFSNSTTLYYLQNRVDMQGRSIAAALRTGSLSSQCLPTNRDGLDLVPSNIDIERCSVKDPRALLDIIERESSVLSVYDYIIIDTSQGHSGLASAAIAAADVVLTPAMLCQFDLMSTITLRAKIIEKLDKYEHWKLFFNGVTHHIDNPKSSHYQYISLYRKTFPNCLPIYIPRSTTVTNSIDRAMAISYQKNERLADAIRQLAGVIAGIDLPVVEAF